jgi:heavy metal efflux system protein
MEGANVNASGGFVTQASTEWTVRAIGRAASVDDLRKTVVNVRNAVPVFLGDVAEIREAPAIRRGIAHRLNGEVVSARVIKQFGADTVSVAAGIRAALHDVQQSLPRGVHLRVVYDQSALVDSALGGVSRAVLIGAGFVVVVLVALLGNVRAALLVTATLPASVALAGLLLKWLGVGINTMTLGGLAIAVGLLVDAAIIVIENILHHPNARVQTAAAEVGRPIAFATLIIIAVFVPLYGMSGIEGRMYQPLAAAVIAAMAGALWLALTVVPLLANMLLRPGASPADADANANARGRPDAAAHPHAGGIGEADSGANTDAAPSALARADTGADEDVRLIRAVKRAYAPLLDRCLRHGWLTIGLALLIALPVTALAFRIGSDFMPRLDEGALLLQTILPADSSLDQVDRSNHRVEDVLREVPEVEDVVRRTGRAERTEDPMPHTLSDVLVVLKADRTRPLDAIEDDMRARIAEVPGVAVLFTTPLGMRIDEGLGGTPADISIRIFGPDLDMLSKLGDRAQRILTGIPGLTDLRAEALTGMPQVRIGIDREAAARVGLSPGDVIRAIRVGLVGEAGPEVWVGQRRFDLVVRLQDERRADLNAIRTLLVDGHDGTRIPLGQLATIEQTFGPGTIRREAGSRRIAVEASVSGRDLGSAAAEARQRLDRELQLPAGYFYDVAGRVESQERAARSLRMAMALALFTVFVLLYVALDSIVDALLILCATPMAFVGSILALLLTGETWNVSSLVGLIGLFGIAVQNSLVLVTQTRALSLPLLDAVREASIGRVRPKLMTAATAILGLLPLLVFPLHGTEIERPLAIVMTGGLVTSTLFTLLVLPVLYAKVHQFANVAQRTQPASGARTT